MKKYLLTIFLLPIVSILSAQTISIVSPEGLTAPYEVSPGTEVIFQFDYFSDAPTAIFTYDEEPVLPDFGSDPAWSQSTDYSDNGNGTYNFTVTVNEEVWVWSGFYQSFFGSWAYSNIFHFQVASDVVASYDDGIVCGDGTGIETLTVADDYTMYQWFLDGMEIDGATMNTYEATSAGAYKVQVLYESELTFSNTLNVVAAEMTLLGSHTQGSTEVEMSGTSGFDSYQWMFGEDPENLTIVDGEVGETYTATLTSEEVYYAVSGVLDGCSVNSPARPISAEAFSIPSIVMNADTNDFDNVCTGTPISLSVNDVYESYQWFNNGNDIFNEASSVGITQNYQEGFYTVAVNPMGWPEIAIVSEGIDVSFFEIEAPSLVFEENGPYCPGEEVNIILGDEGFDYSWYVHSNFQYTEDDLIENPGSVYNLTFEDQLNVTVTVENEGCLASTTVYLNTAANNTPYVSFIDWDDQYLCADSTTDIQVDPWSANDFENYQWYEIIDGDQALIEGETSLILSVEETGIYMVKADLLACESVISESNEIEVFDFSERELFIYADMEAICLGDEATLNISGGESWQDIQWFREDIEIGNTGYEKDFVPMVAGIGESVLAVDEFNGYTAKARHISCPTGQKITGNRIAIRPSVNPDITVDPNYGINGWHLSLYDSIPNYLYCNGEPVSVSVPDVYDSYAWHVQAYTGDGGYDLGDPLDGVTSSSTSVFALGSDWVTAEVELDGCVGVSDPVLIDTWVFSTPAVTSYSNAELCEEGDSTLLHNAFPGNYAYFEWYLDGILIPDSDTDSIWATETGEYTLTIYREECPQFGISSGLGPVVTFLQAEILENETVIYAIPEFGIYYYQWYFNGDPIEAPAATPWLLYKDEMEDGVYTVEVSNPAGCTSESTPYNWSTTGIDDLYEELFSVYPNPTNGTVRIAGLPVSEITELRVSSLEGRLVKSVTDVQSNQIDLSELKVGVYMIEAETRGGTKLTQKIVKTE